MATNIYAKLRAGISTASSSETQRWAEEFAKALPADVSLALHGDLGVGKTTFIQGLARGFGIAEPITSPTFNLYSIHQGPSRRLLHLDAYRIGHAREVEDLLLDDFLISPWCLAVEWPERIASWLPAGTLHLTLNIDADQRHSLKLAV